VATALLVYLVYRVKAGDEETIDDTVAYRKIGREPIPGSKRQIVERRLKGTTDGKTLIPCS
jgi:hypothetical protein